MAKKLNVSEIDSLIQDMQTEMDSTNETINAKIEDYDTKAKEAKEKFMNTKIVPLQEKVSELKSEIARYQQIKKILS